MSSVGPVDSVDAHRLMQVRVVSIDVGVGDVGEQRRTEDLKVAGSTSPFDNGDRSRRRFDYLVWRGGLGVHGARQWPTGLRWAAASCFAQALTPSGGGLLRGGT